MMSRKTMWLLFSAFFVLLALSFFWNWQKGERVTTSLPSFIDISQPLSNLQPGEGESLVFLSVARLREEPNLPRFPERLKGDSKARICFITLSDGKGARKVAAGSGWGLPSALDKAIEVAKADPLSGNFSGIKLDIVKGVQVMDGFDLSKPFPFDKAFFGIAAEGRIETALLPEELMLLKAPGVRGISLSKANSLLGESRVVLPREEIGENAQKIFVFNTISYFGDGKSAWPLFRGNREWKSFEETDVHKSLEAAGMYLARSVKADGSFVYRYDPILDKESRDYNLVRHAGTIYAMLELYGMNRNPELLKATEMAIGYLLRQVKEGTISGRQVRMAVEKGDVKLGGNALAILALAEYARVTGDRRYMNEMRGLGEWILVTQSPDGKFNVHKQGYPSGKVFKFQSEYYPGEAIFALMRIHELTGEKKWLDAADAGAMYQLKVFSKLDDKKLPHDHWLLYGLNEVQRKRPRKEFLDGAMRFAKVIIKAQHTLENQPQPDWEGGFYAPPRSAPTATRVEGLNSAYALAKDYGLPADEEKIRQAIDKGTGFLLRIQVGPENVIYFKDPGKSLGGIRESLVSPEIRIDYVQHSISALLHRPPGKE